MAEPFPPYHERYQQLIGAEVSTRRSELHRLADALRIAIDCLIHTRASESDVAEAADLAEALAMPAGVARTRALHCLEKAPQAPAGLVLALRAELEPACADAIIGKDPEKLGAPRDISETLVALSTAASLKRTVRFIRAQSDVDLAPGTAGGNYYDFTSALMQGEPERAMETMGRWVLGWPAEGQAPATTKEGAGT